MFSFRVNVKVKVLGLGLRLGLKLGLGLNSTLYGHRWFSSVVTHIGECRLCKPIGNSESYIGASDVPYSIRIGQQYAGQLTLTLA